MSSRWGQKSPVTPRPLRPLLSPAQTRSLSGVQVPPHIHGAVGKPRRGAVLVLRSCFPPREVEIAYRKVTNSGVLHSGLSTKAKGKGGGFVN